MGILRTRLAETAPELHAALEQSWKRALEEWLPAIGTSLDSFNSYPHLRNIEAHLDQVVTSFEALPAAKGRLHLRPVELYVLLSCVLYHDVGRVRDNDNHPYISWKMLRAKYGNYGIPSSELARCISSVSIAHDPPPNWPHRLHDIAIDPYGEVRQRPLGALLALADHMDASYTRAVPEYLKSSGELQAKGRFRRGIRAVLADCEAQMVKVALVDFLPTKQTKAPEAIHYHFVKEKELLKEWGLDPKVVKKAIEDAKKTKQSMSVAASNDWIINLLTERKDIATRIAERIKRPIGLFALKPLTLWANLPDRIEKLQLEEDLKKLCQQPPSSLFFSTLGILDWLVIFGLMYASPASDDKNAKNAAPELDPTLSRETIAALCRDSRANNIVLAQIREHLAVLGIPLRGWLVEHQEHLYDNHGFESFEPILDHDFLERVVEGMWNLSVRTFGCSTFKYEELAAEIREPNTIKTRRAVRRLSIAIRKRGAPDFIWVGENQWCWRDRKSLTVPQLSTAVKRLVPPTS